AGARPVGGEDRGEAADEGWLAGPRAELVVVLEGAPVEVLAAEERLAIVDEEVLGVQDAAGGGAEIEVADRGAGARESLERVGVGLDEALLGEEPDAHAARDRDLERLDDRLEPARL